jgi:hypothetical protein
VLVWVASCADLVEGAPAAEAEAAGDERQVVGLRRQGGSNQHMQNNSIRTRGLRSALQQDAAKAKGQVLVPGSMAAAAAAAAAAGTRTFETARRHAGVGELSQRRTPGEPGGARWLACRDVPQ